MLHVAHELGEAERKHWLENDLVLVVFKEGDDELDLKFRGASNAAILVVREAGKLTCWFCFVQC